VAAGFGPDRPGDRRGAPGALGVWVVREALDNPLDFRKSIPPHLSPITKKRISERPYNNNLDR